MEHIEAEEILRSGDFDRFLKATESATFDCKGSPYQLDNSNQKQELAKDVAGFANASGGITIIGLSTIRPTSLFLEEVHEVRPFSKDLIDPKQYTDVLKEWIYPNPHVEPRWWPSACDPSKGLFAIQVYAQTSQNRPFLATRSIDDKGKAVGTVFGYFERRRTDVDHFSVQRLQSLLNAGLQNEEILKKLDALETLVREYADSGKRSQSQAPNPVNHDQVMQRMRDAIALAELTDKPVYALVLRPMREMDIPTLFRSRQEPIVKLLEKPPTFREAGFHLTSSGNRSQSQGQRRTVVAPGHELLEFWRDGTVIAIMRGDSNFLAWPGQGPNPVVNPYALVEALLEFVTLVKQLCDLSKTEQTEAEFTIHLEGMVQDVPSGIAMLLGGSLVPRGRAPSSVFTEIISADLKSEDAGDIIYRMVEPIYHWYGLEDVHIPFRKRDGNGNLLDSIDIERFTK